MRSLEKGDAMRVAAQIGERLLGSSKRRFGVYHPFAVLAWREILGPGAGIGERFQFPRGRPALPRRRVEK
jgi:hypothetical protein